MISVVAILTAKPGERPALLSAIEANLAAVRAEAGCIEYAPVQDTTFSPAKFGEDSIVILEKWASPQALADHGKAPHMATFSAAVRDLLAGRPSIHFLQPA